MQILTERWRVEYNTERPHSALGYRPPAPQAILPKQPGHGDVENAPRFPHSVSFAHAMGTNSRPVKVESHALQYCCGLSRVHPLRGCFSQVSPWLKLRS